VDGSGLADRGEYQARSVDSRARGRGRGGRRALITRGGQYDERPAADIAKNMTLACDAVDLHQSRPARSRARAHLSGRDDRLVSVAPSLERCGGRFGELIDLPAAPERIVAPRSAERIGRPLGSRLAALTGRDPQARVIGVGIGLRRPLPPVGLVPGVVDSMVFF
jgi:hypothetical protein